MTDEQPIYDEEKMQQKVVYPTKQTPSYADWALYNMGAALEQKVDGMGDGLPEHTSEDAGKVLKVTAQNELAWATDEQGHAQVQANWNETDNTQPSYIQNKPTIPSDFEYIKDVSGGPYTITANGNTTITAETLANAFYRKDIIVFVKYVSDKVMVKPRQEMDTNQIKFDVVNSSLDTTCYIDYTVYAKDITPGRDNPEGVNICSVIGTVGRKYAAVPNSTTTDADKVLTVGANGVPAWQAPSGGGSGITKHTYTTFGALAADIIAHPDALIMDKYGFARFEISNSTSVRIYVDTASVTDSEVMTVSSFKSATYITASVTSSSLNFTLHYKTIDSNKTIGGSESGSPSFSNLPIDRFSLYY